MTETLRRVQLVSVPTLTEPKRNPKDKPDGSSQPKTKTSEKTKTPEKTPPTKRFSLKLNNDDGDCCMEYSFTELMEAYNKDDDMIDPLNDNDEANLRALERKFQEKYGPKRRRYGNAEDYIDKGLGYDETDPFIDNEEAYDELVPSTLTTKHGGFYINSGELEFRPLLPEEINDDDEDDIRPHVSKRKRKEIGKEPGNKLKDKKKKLNLANTSSSKKTVAQMLNQRKLNQKNGLDDDEVDEDDEIEQIDIENNKHNNGKEAVVSATVCDVIESVAKGEVQPNGIECLSSAKPPANISVPSQHGKSVQLQPGKSVPSQQPVKSMPSQQPVKSVPLQQSVKPVSSQQPVKSVPSQQPVKSVPLQQPVKSKEKQKSEEAFMSHALNKIIEQSLGDFPNSGQISASSQNRIKTTQSSSLLPSTPMKIEDMIVRNLSKNTKENAHKQPEIIIDIASSPETPRQQQPKQSSQSQKNLNQVQVIKQPQSQPSHSQAQQQAMQKQRKIKQLAQTVLQQQTVQQKPNHNIYNRPTLADQIKKKSSSQSSSMLQSSQQQREQLIQQQLQREKSQQQQRELQMQREKAQQRELQRELQREKQSSSSKASNHTSINITAIPNANAVSNESVSSSNRQTNQNSSSQRYSSSAVTSNITPTSSALDLSPQSIQAIQLGMLQGTNFNALQNQSANPISAHSLTIPSHNYLSHLFSSTSNRNLIPSRSSLPSIGQLDNSPLGFNPIYLHQFATTHQTDGRGRNSN